MKSVVLTAACGMLSSAAMAQDGAMWSDDRGRVMSMQFAGGGNAQQAPLDRTAVDMVDIFKRACITTRNDPAAIASALNQGEPAFRSEPFTIAGSRKMAPVVLPIWRAEGVVISQTDGFFAAPIAQCNATFYVNNLPDATSLQGALTAALGSGPINASEAVRKNGKPNLGYAPMWSTADDYVVEAHLARESRYMPGNRVQLVMRAKAKKKS